MESFLVIKAVISLAAVILIMLFVLKLIQKYTSIGYKLNSVNEKSDGLKIENIVYIDELTKIITLKNTSGNGYIIAVSKNNVTLIDKISND